MVGIAERNQLIEEYKRQIEEAQGAPLNVPSVWGRFNDLVSKMPPEQKAYVETNAAAVKAKQDLNALFVELLFEQNKCSMVSDPRFAQAAERYVDVVEAAAEFAQKNRTLAEENEALAEENEALKAEIARLKAEAI